MGDQVHYLSLELASMDPYVASSDGVTTLSSPVRLAQLKNELSSLKNKYSESHPDIKRLTREIDGLEKEVLQMPCFSLNRIWMKSPIRCTDR